MFFIGLFALGETVGWCIKPALTLEGFAKSSSLFRLRCLSLFTQPSLLSSEFMQRDLKTVPLSSTNSLLDGNETLPRIFPWIGFLFELSFSCPPPFRGVESHPSCLKTFGKQVHKWKLNENQFCNPLKRFSGSVVSKGTMCLSHLSAGDARISKNM